MDRTLLLIEDERPLVVAIESKLKKYNFNIVTARTCEQALGYLKDVDPIHVIWLDHYLIGNDTGLDFIAKVKTEKKWRDIPIFVVSNTGSTTKRQVYMRLGAVKYYVKANHRLEAIVKEIERYLKTNKKN